MTMKSARSAIIACCLLASMPAATAQPITCALAEAPVLALRTDLMVAALGCGQRSEYNAVVRRHRTTLARAEREMIAAFDQAAVSRDYDTWITTLANERSLALAADRVTFCARTRAVFREAKAASANAAALQALSTRRSVAYPPLEAACAAKPPVS